MIYSFIFLFIFFLSILITSMYFQEKKSLLKLNVLRNQIVEKDKEISILEEKLKNQDTFHLKEVDMLKKNTQDYEKIVKEYLPKEFENISNNIIDLKKNELLKKTEELFKPLKETVDEFSKTALAYQSKNDSLIGSVQKIVDENAKVTNILSSSGSKSGIIGESILTGILDSCGLKKDTHYFFQKEKANKDGYILRPDIIVNLPNGEQIVIDSKSTLLGFDLNDPEEKILQSARQHIKDLISRNYSGVIKNGPNIVLMFVPYDYVFNVISKSSENELDYARRKGIIIVCPSTIVQMLTFVYKLWIDKKQNDNIEEIINAASDLIDKYCGICESWSKVGKCINSLSASYNEATVRLAGKGGLHYRIKNLKDKGIESKEVPEISVSISSGDISDIRSLEDVDKVFNDADL